MKKLSALLLALLFLAPVTASAALLAGQNESAITPWTVFTQTGTWTANTNYYAQWKRQNHDMSVRGIVSCTGTPTATQLAIEIPTGYRMSAVNMSTTTYVRNQVGTGTLDSGSGYYYPLYVRPASDTQVKLEYPVVSGANFYRVPVSNTAPFTAGAGYYYTFEFTVPIVGW